ncbi:MAG TPA: S8 family serine peptidase [Chitinophagaceae bacterium]|jgi:subtilisin family serine protease|nr:S8 family serine peptidase [Chitinophagaceae bacterium]
MSLKKTILLSASLSILVLFGCKKEKQETISDPGECVTGNSAGSGNIIPGKYIIAYDPSVVGARSMSRSNLLEKGQSVLEQNNIPASRIQEVFGGESGGFIATLTDAEAASLRNDISVSAVEPDRIIALATCFTVAEPRLITWNIQRVGYGDGTGKTAWIIDTGIDFDHPDLTVDATRSRSFITGVTSADDENGHGTHVAGIIGGKNNTIGVLGVASGATLISLRVLGADGVGTLSSIIQALAYVNTNGKAGDVVNMSLGEDVSSPTLIQQVQSTASRGIYIAIAAGNDGEPANKYSPANANGANIYTVSAIDSTDKFASFSNYGNDVVDYAAPGVQILSTFSNGRYAWLSGTSMAAPHMAGLLLLKGTKITTSGFAKNDPDGTADPIVHY